MTAFHLRDLVALEIGGIRVEGEIRGRTFTSPMTYDVRVPGGALVKNVAAERLEAR